MKSLDRDRYLYENFGLPDDNETDVKWTDGFEDTEGYRETVATLMKYLRNL